MQKLVVESQEGKKSRSFSATLLAVATANGLMEESSGKIIRPVWAMFAGTENQLRPFMTNLLLGHKAGAPSNWHGRRGSDSERFEFLRSCRFQVTWQKEPEGCIATIFHPELFRLDPGMVDPAGINFLLFVPEDWIGQQEVEIEDAVDHVKKLGYALSTEQLASMTPTAYLFAAYIDRRTNNPLITDGRFYLQMLVAALDQGLASFPGDDLKWNHRDRKWGHAAHHSFHMTGGSTYGSRDLDLGSVGLRHAISFRATHEVFETFLAEQVATYFEKAESADFRAVADLVDLDSLGPLNIPMAKAV